MKGKLVEDRFDVIRRYVEHKEVLDCGCVGGGPGAEDWLHGRLVEVSKRVVGVDIQKEGVERLRKLGYEVVWGDVTTMNLGEKFDVIVAGELIEHLPNQGLFLENMKRHLKRRGVLVLTTPNAWAFPFPYQWTELITWNAWRDKAGSGKWSPFSHVVLHSPDTLSALAEMHGFEIELWGCVVGSPPKRGLRRLIRNRFYSLFPQFSPSLLAILRPRFCGFGLSACCVEGKS